MESWYKISQSAARFSANQWVGIHRQFTLLALRAGNPPEVALFANDDTSKTYDYYFSPAAALLMSELIARYPGTWCESPIGSTPVTPVVSVHEWESVFLKSSK
jgi:hypothetical protein